MLQRYSVFGGLSAALAALGLAIAAGAAAAPADDLKEAQKLYTQGKLQPALDKVDEFIKAQPKDPQGRFLKGLVLTEQKRTQEAIQVFTGLTEDYPELPEPYNNLAVLYASQGNYDKARSALELAIHTHPTYATAHENLGDIYAELASRAYDRALQLDKNNASAQVKLSMVKDLFSAQKVAQRAQVEKVQVASAEPPKAAPPPAPTKAEPAKPTPPPKTAAAEAPQPEAPKVEPAKTAPPTKSAAAEPAKTAPSAAAELPKKPAAAGGDDKAQLAATVGDWARTWSAKDVPGYLAHYAPDFEVPKGETRASWEKQRKERIEKPKSIQVDATVVSTEVNGNEATVKIRQAYRSDTLKSNGMKTLQFERAGQRWLIKQERNGG